MEEKALNVPISLSVIDGEEIEQKQIKDVAGLIKQVPNINFYSRFGKDQINFRGLNSSSTGLHNPVIIYVDGILQSSITGFNVKFLNVDRVEVIRGPAGTMYGEDAIGGVINIITKKPSNDLNGFIGAEYGSNNYMMGKFGINSPIIEDKLYFGLSGLIDKDDGEITNHYLNDKKANSTKDHKINANLRFTPTDELDINLQLGEEYNKENWFYGNNLPYKDGYVSRDKEIMRNTNFDYPTYNITKSTYQGLNIKYNFSNLEFSWLLAHKKVKLDGQFDLDLDIDPKKMGLFSYQTYTTDSTSTEFRLISQDNYIKWIAGFFAEIEKMEQPREGKQFTKLSEIYDSYSQGQGRSNTSAIFGQVITPLGAEFEFHLGARFVNSKKKADFSTFTYMLNTPKSLDVHFVDNKTESAFLPKIALLYKINENSSGYFNITRGYMAGGYNSSPSYDNAKYNKFKPQTSTNYELGFKSAYNNLNLGADIFYMDIKNIHTWERINRILMTSNAPKARSYGAELEFDYAIGDLLLDGSFGLLKAKYIKHVYQALDGNKIEKSPTHTARIGFGYYSPIKIYARFDLRNRGEIYYNDKNTVKDKSYTTADAKIGYTYKDLDVYLYGKNLNDAKYIDYALRKSNGTDLAIFGRSREIGVGIEYKF